MKLKKLYRVLEFNQSQWLKTYIEFNTQKRMDAEKNNHKEGKVLHKLLNNAIYGKTMEHLRNTIDVKLVNNEKDNLKCTSKPSYMSHKIFDRNLVEIRKSKFALKLNKPAYIEMWILELSKVLMYKFQYDYIKNKYYIKLRLLFTDTGSLMYEIKTEDVYEGFSSDKEMSDFRDYSSKSKYYDDSNKSVIGKVKNETGGVAIKEFVGLTSKMDSLLVDNTKRKKGKPVNKNVVGTISHNEYKDVLLKNKCLRHSMNRIQIKDHRIGTYEINKISLSYFDDKIYI